MPETSEQIRARLQAQIEAIERGSTRLDSRTSVEVRRSSGRDAHRDSAEACDIQDDGARRSFEDSAPRSPMDYGEPSSYHALYDDLPCEEEAHDKGEAADKSPEAAFKRIVRLASRSEQASSKLRARLLKEGFPQEAVDAAINRACACGLVDDARYAEVLVRSRISQGRGRQGIVLELEKLGIDFPELDEAFEECGQTEVERAVALLDRRPPQAKNLRAAAYRRLVQKGYGSDVASSASRLWCEAQDQEDR